MWHTCQMNRKMDGLSSTALFIPDKIMLKADTVINHCLVVSLEQKFSVATVQGFGIFLRYLAQIWMVMGLGRAGESNRGKWDNCN